MNTVTYIAHGGGPLPLLGHEGHVEMVDSLQQLTSSIRKPDAIIVVSAHWEETQPVITSGSAPSLIYDYYGFPDEAYEVQYPASGMPSLAEELHSVLQKNGFNSRLDAERGFDHGAFVPLKIMYPDASIPCIQLSMLNTLEPEAHIKMGEALSMLADQNLLILGSGLSFHNMKAFSSTVSPEMEQHNIEFEKWLNDTCMNAEITEGERKARLVEWATSPGARVCHPREEHLLPLHVCYGAAGRAATSAINIKVMGRKASNFIWQ